ncbi:hypothetical protein [Reichenbachiella sp.]|uniref:hypothetical protein n=1 Tax=Reichenbachiella sp. TaxID=2184521 RepID=UPI003BB0B750
MFQKTNSTTLVKLIPPFWACLFDVFITAIHQPADYWRGELEFANEGNPIGNLFMTNHISGLFVVTLFELVVVMFLANWLTGKAQKVFLLFVVLAHSAAVTTWIAPRYGFWSFMFLTFFNAFLVVFVEDLEKRRAAKTI